MMRKILFILLAFISLAVNAQTSYGKMTVFPNKKMKGILFKPQLGFCKIDDRTLLVLCYNDQRKFASFNEESKLLFRTDDDSLYRAPICPELGVRKQHSLVMNSLNRYTTNSFYTIPEELLSDILEGKHDIIKVRITFTNGNLADYDITENYIKTLSEGLRESYSSASTSNEIRKQNMENDEEGF